MQAIESLSRPEKERIAELGTVSSSIADTAENEGE